MNKELEEAMNKWNWFADKDNQWSALDSDEKFELIYEEIKYPTQEDCVSLEIAFKALAKSAWDAAIDECFYSELP